MAIATPGIRLLRDAAGYRMEQTRPAVGPVLASLPLDQALEQVTNLLPICGAAQRIAARRAIEAAQGAAGVHTPEDDAVLLREQLQSSLWRLTVDWPGLVDEPQNLEALRHALRTGELSALRRHVREQLDGLDRLEMPGEVADWVSRGACTAARVIERARVIEGESGGPEPVAENGKTDREPGGRGPCPARLSPESVLERSRQSDFWPVGEAAFEPPPGEVGAWAMRRHALAGDPGLPGGPLTKRLLAQALDAAFLAGAEPEFAVINGFIPTGTHGGSAWPPAPDRIGWAMTARGPLVHRVTLEPGDESRARRWDVLAPTDWHFGPQGPVAWALSAWETAPGPDFVRFYVAGFDPCAVWSVRDLERSG